MNSEQPKRRINISIEIGADSWDDVQDVLRELYRRIDDGPILAIASGGWSAGYSCVSSENKGQTGDSYRKQIQDYRKSKNEITIKR